MSSPIQHFEQAGSRRDFLCRAGAGFGAIALYGLLAEQGLLQSQRASAAETGALPRGLTAKLGTLTPRAKNVIFLFMDGGPSHIDTFDHKPLVNEYAGRPLPKTVKRVFTPMSVTENPLLACRRTWKRYGQSGHSVSDWYPHVGECVDDICQIRSCTSDGINHVGSVCMMNTGSVLAGRPSLGAWVNYGLGTENRNLPGFVVLLDNDHEPPGGSRVWGTGFMPATFQGTRLLNGSEPILNLHPAKPISDERQRGKLDYLRKLNQRHVATRSGDDQLEARIASYELAFRMQSYAPDAVDLARETAATQQAYGLGDPTTAVFGRNCLMARRLVERGVRFVQLYSGSGSRWDAHSRIEQNHSGLCRQTDRPIASLLMDLKQRGLLKDTLVIWGGEFGRTPMSEKGDGRDHNPYGFTMWLAGGGVKGGHVVGATDDFGMHATENRVTVRDLHATILALLGLDHTELIYLHQGRPERPTVNEGTVIDDVFA
jgi:Protein of unknown function (DUF1501)